MRYLLIHAIALVGLGAALYGCSTTHTEDVVTIGPIGGDLYDTTPIDLDNLPSKEDTDSVFSTLSPGQQMAFGKTAKDVREWTQSGQNAFFGVALTPLRALGEIRDRSRVNGLEPELMPHIAAYWKRLISR